MRVLSHTTDASSLGSKAPNPTSSATRGYSLTAFSVPLLPRPPVQELGEYSLSLTQQRSLRKAERSRRDETISAQNTVYGRPLDDRLDPVEIFVKVDLESFTLFRLEVIAPHPSSYPLRLFIVTNPGERREL
jgi:hypothetical protein